MPVRVALRNTAAIALPLAVGVATGHALAGVGVAVGALNTMFSDQPGSYRLRMRRMLLTAAAAGLSAFAGGAIGAHTAWLVAAGLAWGIGGGLLVALGPAAGRVGLTSMILLVVTSARASGLADAFGAALLIFSGGLLQMLFAIAAWPLQRFRPERDALAGVCRGLAASARGRSERGEAPPVTGALLDIETLLHGRHRAQGPAMETFRVLARLVENIRLELLALGDLERDIVPREARSSVARLREYAARTLEATALALETGSSPLSASASLEGFDSARTNLQHCTHEGREPSRRIAIARADALGGLLRALVRNAEFAGSRGELRAEAAQARLPAALRPRNPLAILRANLGLSSVAFRHALRCGACLAIAIASERIAGLPHGYWLPMTTAIVLKPDFGATFRVGLLRVAGTLLGLVLTTALVHYAFGADWQRIALLALLCFGFRMLTTVHYGIGVALLTGLVVILLSFHGDPPRDTMLARGIATALGCALALAIYAVWPTWERGRVRAALADLIGTYRDYLVALLHDDPSALRNARSAARIARTNAQASLDRLRDEPHGKPELATLANAVFANANRFVRAGMALEAALRAAPERPEHERVRAFADRIDANLGALAESLRGTRPVRVEPLRAAERQLAEALARIPEGAATRDVAVAVADACDRIADSVDTLARLLDATPADAGAGAGRSHGS